MKRNQKGTLLGAVALTLLAFALLADRIPAEATGTGSANWEKAKLINLPDGTRCAVILIDQIGGAGIDCDWGSGPNG